MTRTLTAILGLGLVLLSLARIAGETRGLAVERTRVGTIPITVFSDAGAPPAPAVIIAHGFAGSQQLMAPFATTLARAGYVAITLDLAGHGRNPEPLTGDVTTADGATATLLREMAAVSSFARALPAADERLALIGHSMASDLVVRAAIADPGVVATIAVSLFSPEVTETAPRNLLVVTGAWEPGLTEEALRVAGLGTGAPAEAFTTRGDFADGTARRAVLAPQVEHVGVLYSATSLTETVNWLNATFGRDGPAVPDRRGVWVAPWFLGAALLAWGLAPRLPRLALPVPARPPRRRAFALAAILPALLTPLIAGLLPEGLLPVPVADYLAVHFLVYGLLTAFMVRRLGWPRPARVPLGPGTNVPAPQAQALEARPGDRSRSPLPPASVSPSRPSTCRSTASSLPSCRSPRACRSSRCSRPVCCHGFSPTRRCPARPRHRASPIPRPSSPSSARSRSPSRSTRRGCSSWC